MSTLRDKFENMDLVLENYTLDEIYVLFGLNTTDALDVTQLRKAKHVLAKMHPDKSRLPKKYFEFFYKAYQILLQIAECNQHARSTIQRDDYASTEFYNSELHRLISENTHEAHAKFNEMFEKINQDLHPTSQNGYNDWFRGIDQDTSSESSPSASSSSSSSSHRRPITHAEMFAKHREKFTTPTSTDIGICPAGSTRPTSGYSQLTEEPSEYTSDMFGTISYADLKRTYTSPWYDVSDSMLDHMNRPKNIGQLTELRKSSITPPTVAQSNAALRASIGEDHDMSTHRAYQLNRELERSQHKNKQFACTFFKILN
jgi:hypothetical protein